MNIRRPLLPQHSVSTSRQALAGFAVLALAATVALGQRAPSADNAASSPARKNEDTIVLSPFEVKEESDRSYGALNSNSLTAFSTELKTMPVSADVFSETFMRDVGLNSIEEVISNFSAGAGTFSLSPDQSAANSQPLDRNANGSLSLRGLSAPTMQVNGFFPAGGNGINATGITSRYNIERVEVIGGPQALLYGVSGSGGVTNLITKRAQFNRRSSGELRYEVNHYGYKQGQLDYSWGSERVAIRVALLDQVLGARRLFIGGPLQAGYLQLALRPFKTTVLRYSLERSNLDRINANSGNMTLTALNTANDARSGQQLHWLVATGQVTAAANGAPSGAGAIMNGQLTWDNVDSIVGGVSGEVQKHALHTLTAESRWNSWLSTQASAGYRTEARWKMMNSGATFLAPNVASNPLGTWAVTIGSGSGASTNYWQPVRQKVARFSALAENELFSGRAKSKTVVGLDTTRTDGALLGYFYVQMDENWKPVMSASRFNGFTPMPSVYWPVTNGPVRNPLWDRDATRISWNGVNYERTITNYSVPSLVSPSNPEGLTGNGSGSSRHTTDIQSGYYAANFTDWFNGKLTTLVGVRMGRAYSRSSVEATLPNQPSVGSDGLSEFTAFSAGANLAVTRTVRAYVEVSDNYNPAATSFADPYGEFSKSANGIGAEAGVKVTAPDGRVSGTLAVFRTKSKNELHAFTSTLTNYINPAGLNGRLGAAGNTINVDRQSLGAQIAVTASPKRGWRMRVSGAYVGSEVATEKVYSQLYNDQFHANAQGQVTYQDGAQVYVNPSRTEVLAASSPNAVPLTLALMNTQSSRYWANPVAVSSAITSNSALATVLRTVDPVHGPILTGQVGLPVSKLQIAPNPLAPPPGRIVVTQKGDIVTGVPTYSLNLTNVYTMQSGWFKGVRIGGSMNASWRSSLYYYYPNGAADPNNRGLWMRPDLVNFSGILGYERKIDRYVFSTQLNVQNMFNNYSVLLLPNYVNGWVGPNNATFNTQPRMYVWSMGVEF